MDWNPSVLVSRAREEGGIGSRGSNRVERQENWPKMAMQCFILRRVLRPPKACVIKYSVSPCIKLSAHSSSCSIWYMQGYFSESGWRGDERIRSGGGVTKCPPITCPIQSTIKMKQKPFVKPVSSARISRKKIGPAAPSPPARLTVPVMAWSTAAAAARG